MRCVCWQVALCGTQIWWTTEVNIAFARLEEGYENALKDYNKKQIAQLNSLITMLVGDLSKGDRQKIMTICTIDVHARDVIGKLINLKVDNSQAFAWLSQLRHRWDDKEKDCFANICDAQFRYSHEYLGNTPRLVITPLTDRCVVFTLPCREAHCIECMYYTSLLSKITRKQLHVLSHYTCTVHIIITSRTCHVYL